MTSPYDDMPPSAFWRTAVGERSPLDFEGLYQPRFQVTRRHRVFTAGSCFAQHVGRALRANGFSVIDAEPVPSGIRDEAAQRFGYRTYSARYGNIYTIRQMLQLMREAYGDFTPAEPVWRKGDAFFDSQRPAVEPDGLPSEGFVLSHRARHLAQVRRAVESADIFVFTFGLTEGWTHTASGDVYPTAPGAIAGEYDPDLYSFRNFGYEDVLSDFRQFRKLIRSIRPNARFIVTVSPVPLTATASGAHVMVATTRSKAILRAVCGAIYDEFADVDYFPSYEIITTPTNHGVFFAPNKRSVTPQGVAAAMGLFLHAHAPGSAPAPRSARSDADVQCEESLLDAFAKGR